MASQEEEKFRKVLNDYMSQVIAMQSAGNATRNTMQQSVILDVLEWADVKWTELRDLTHHTVYVTPDVADRLSELNSSDPEDDRLLHQLFVKPDRLGRLLERFSKEDEVVDAIVAVDGLASRPFPNFEVKRYVENCRFPLNGRDRVFEHRTVADKDRRKHVSAVRRLYSMVPPAVYSKGDVKRVASRTVYLALREVFSRVAGFELENLRDTRGVDTKLIPNMVETYVDMMEEDRIRRIVDLLPKTEKRGRKRTPSVFVDVQPIQPVEVQPVDEALKEPEEKVKKSKKSKKSSSKAAVDVS